MSHLVTTPTPPHPSEETILGYHAGALAKPQEKAVRLHLQGCRNCRKRSAEIANELGSLSDPSPLDQRELRYIVDRLVLRNELIEHEGTTALYLALQARARPRMVSQILRELVCQRTQLHALVHYLIGDNWDYASTSLLISGQSTTQVKVELDAHPLQYRSFPKCLEHDRSGTRSTAHFTRVKFQGAQQQMTKLCRLVEQEVLVTTPHRKLVAGCIVACIANLTADRKEVQMEAMVAAPTAAAADEIHRRLAWFQQTYHGLTFQVTGEAEQPVPFAQTGQHLYN